MEKVKEKVVKLRLNASGNTLSNLSQLEEWQWFNKQNVKDLQRRRLTNLLKYSYEQVPYYKEVLPMNQLFDSSEIVNLNKFSTIPVLTKDIIRNQFDRLKSMSLNDLKWYKNTSGGSTGEPVVFIQDKAVFEWEQSNKILFDEWSGRYIGEKQIRLWGSERDLLVGRETFRSNFGKWMRNEIWLNAFLMSDENMEDYVTTINTFQPVQILSYVESIYELARYIEDNNLQIHSPRSIMTTAGTLFPHMREVIERVFKAPVFNRYGSREVGDIACECEHHEGLHVSSPTHYVEILREDGTNTKPGELGEIVVTSLMNFAMPLIRYKIGDMGIWSESDCSCGRGFPLIKKVTGRVTDTFLTREKKPVSGGYFEGLFYYQNWIKQFQVIQEDYELIRILIVLKDRNQADPFQAFRSDIEKITNDFKRVMGESCNIQFEFVTKIDTSASGKYRYLISKVKRD